MWEESGNSEREYVEMDPFERKGKDRAWRERARAAGVGKGPPVPVGKGTCPVGVVGEGVRQIRVGEGHLLPVSQCTPPLQSSVYPASIFAAELEFIEWKYRHSDSTNTTDTRNQPEFSFFSWTREAG